MYIHHIALLTKNIEKMRTFYETYFHAVSNEQYHNKKTQFKSYFLTFESGSQLELIQKKYVGDITFDNIGYVHIALSVGTRQDVDRIAAQFVEDKFPLLNGPRVTGDGFYEAVIQDPEGNLIELTTDQK